MIKTDFASVPPEVIGEFDKLVAYPSAFAFLKKRFVRCNCDDRQADGVVDHLVFDEEEAGRRERRRGVVGDAVLRLRGRAQHHVASAGDEGGG